MNVVHQSRSYLHWYGALLLLGILAFFPTRSAGQVQSKEKTLSIDDGRPVYEAVQQLEAMYGQIITYEDPPPYMCLDDMQDVGPDVAKNYYDHPPGQRPTVLVPKGGRLEIKYSPSSTPAELLQQVIDASAAAGLPQFRIEKGLHRLHVVPEKFRGKNCELAAQEAVLDARITLPEVGRNGDQMLYGITQAVTEATPTHAKVDLGLIPLKFLYRLHGTQGIDNEKARDVLSAFLDRVNRNLSWALLCDLDGCFLNLHRVVRKDLTREGSPQ